jgi:DNA polymerase III subunit beta
MRFLVQRDPLLNALQKTHSIVEKKNTMQILSNILCSVTGRELSLYATDLEVGVKIILPIEGGIEGKLTLSAKHFLEIVKELPNKTIEVTKKENNWIEIVCGKSKFSIVSLSAEEYPTLPNFDDKNYFDTKTDYLKEMIDCTIFAASSDTTRVSFNGVFFEHLGSNLMRMTGTDGTRLSFIDQEVFLKTPDLKRGIILPRKGLGELRKLLEEAKETIPFSFDHGYVFSQVGDCAIFIRLIEGEYPDYRQVIPKIADQVVRINHDVFLSALKRVNLLVHEKSRAIKFSLQHNSLTLSSSNPDMGEAREEMDVQYNGEPIDIGFNSKYLLECLPIIKTEYLEINFKDRLSPGILRGVGKPNHTYLIMPMRI